MSDETRQKIRKLSQQLQSLRRQKYSLDEEAEQWAEKRNTVHKQIKDLRLEAAKTRDRRDVINAKVKTLKTRRDESRNIIKEKIEEIKRLKKKLQLLYVKRSRADINLIRKEKEDIEWKIQTSSLSLQEEKPLVEKANQFDIELETHRQFIDTKNQIENLRTQINAMNEEADLFHKSLKELADQSQELHGIMIENLNKAQNLQSEADEYHQEFLQSKQKPRKLHQECIEFEKRVEALKECLAETERKRKKEQQEKVRERLREEAVKKLEKGRKLSLDEFKLLAEDEESG